MSATPADLYNFAIQVSSASQVDETTQRASISRAYYACYHACCDWHLGLATQGHNIGPAGGKHQVLINQLCNPDGPTDRLFSKSLGYSLRDLRDYRVLADYELGAQVEEAYADEARAKASTILKKLKLLP